MTTTLSFYTSIPHCHSEVNSRCVACNTGYTLSNGNCVASCPFPLTNCALCDDSTGRMRCDTCMPSFYPLPFGEGCVPEPYCAVPDCQTCHPNSMAICVKCKGGYSLQKDGLCKRKIPLWFWIVVGTVGALLVILILYAALHKGESQKEWAAKLRNRVQ